MVKVKVSCRGTCRNYCRPGLSLIAMRSVEHHEARSFGFDAGGRASESLRKLWSMDPW
jgi:hypothetical protein